jgi:hypothetical protein
MQIDTRNRSEFNDLDLKEKINSLQKLRLQFYAEDEDSEKVDELRDEIQRLISENFEVLPFDFILVHFTKFGEAPSLLYDDNGHFAVSGDGFQEVPLGNDPETIVISTLVKQEYWKKSPKEALKYYMNN